MRMPPILRAVILVLRAVILCVEGRAGVVCRCLSCDTDLRGMQQQGRRSPPPSKPSLLPKLLALDPKSAALYSASLQAPDTGVHA